jgi:glycosyltransferase involved in cell wall biosynthesis
VRALRDEGCEVLVLTGQPNYPEGVSYKGYKWWSIGTEQHDGVTIFRIPLVPRGRGGAIRLALNYLSFVVFATVLSPWLLRAHSVDKIFVFGMSPILQAIPAVWLARLKKAALVTWVQDLWPDSLSAAGFVNNQKVLSAVSRVVSWIYRSSDLILVQSLAFVAPVQGMAGNTAVKYHPNPGDFAFSETAGDQKCPVNFEPGFNVVFAGNMGTVQSLDTIVSAAEILRGEKSIRLVMVGSGSRVDWLKTEIERRNLTNVRLAGRFPLSSMPSIMANASALLVSLKKSQIMSQTVPSKVQAYLAAGKPIIASLDGEGARIVLEAGAGVAAPAEDAQGLANAIRDLKSKPAVELERIGLNARTYYEQNFEPHLLARKLSFLLAAAQKNSP